MALRLANAAFVQLNDLMLQVVAFAPTLQAWARDYGLGVLTPDDALPLPRLVVAIAGLMGLPAVVVQHGIVVAREDANHTVAGNSFTWGPAFADVLDAEMKGLRHRIHAIGFPAERRGMRFPVRGGPANVLFVGTGVHALNLTDDPRHEQNLVAEIMRRLSTVRDGTTLVIRPHPSGPQMESYSASGPGVNVVVERKGTIGDAIRRASIVVTTISTGMVEATMAGVPVIACPDAMTDLVSRARTIPGVYWAESPADAGDLLSAMLAGIVPNSTTSEGQPYLTQFIGWDRLAKQMKGLNPLLSAPAAVDHARALIELVGSEQS